MNGPEEARALSGALAGGQPRALSMTERLFAQRERLEEQLRLTNEAIDALESDPNIAKAVDAIARLGHIHL